MMKIFIVNEFKGLTAYTKNERNSLAKPEAYIVLSMMLRFPTD